MNLYFAPLEGLGTKIFRNTHFEMFGGSDAYFAPFITPSDNEKITRKTLKDIIKEDNKTNLKAQVLVNKAECFLKFADKIKEIGYDEININLGCPSGTVVKKGRGAGFLKDTESLDRFFYEIFEKSDLKISVKTRTGYYSNSELESLMKIYNKYPLSMIIIHPRAREDFYNGSPDMDAFKAAYEMSLNKVVYNGDILNKKDYEKIVRDFPDLHGVMIGRGAIINPKIFREIRGEEKITTFEIISFLKRLASEYKNLYGTDIFVLNKLKEILFYQLKSYPDEKKILKAVKKANSSDYLLSVIERLPERI